MSYRETVEYLYGLQKAGMKFGLDNIRRLMAALGDPHRAFRAVHVAGTNGKGSTSAMIESIIRTGGARTGLFTSPHLVSFTERIRVNGMEISEEEVIDLARKVRGVAEEIPDFSPTFFEVITAMAFLHFQAAGVEWAVVEVGMGGRLDATNVLLPKACVITSIGLDHREFLGKTLREIAGEKAGIMKEGVPVIIAAQEPEALEVIEERAKEKSAPLFRCGIEFSAETISSDGDGNVFNYRGACEHEHLALPLAGIHQVMNAGLAIKAVEVLRERRFLGECDVSRGLIGTAWPGRIEMIRATPPVMIDGAHNPQAAVALARHLDLLKRERFQRIILVIGIMGDKDIEGILKPLLPLAAEVIFCAPAYGRAASAERLAAFTAESGHASRTACSVSDALSAAEGLAASGDLIVVTGSFYTIGEAKEAIGVKAVLGRLRE